MAQRYDTYKDSGVQWLGEIPGHWGGTTMGRIISSPLQYGASESGDSIEHSGDWRYIRITDITLDGKLKHEGQKFLPQEIAELYPLKHGDLLFARSGATVGKSYLFKESINACFAGYLIKARMDKEIALPEYVSFFTKSVQYDEWKNRIFIQATIQNIGADKYSRLYIPLPPLSEQRAIVDYLDDKCGKIDEWIEKKQKEVELLGEMKQRVIADAVTRGLNTNVKMKPTNIPWLPEVPEHWECVRLKALFNQRNESYSPYEQLQVLSLLKDVGVIPYSEKGNIGNKAKEDYSSYNVTRKGDIVMNSMNVIIGSVDITNYDGYISPAYYALYAKEGVSTEYYNYIFHMKACQKHMRSLANGILEIRLRISTTNLFGMSYPVPPLSEQREIVAYIADKTAKIDKMVENVNKEIENLKEYKQRLISDVVTGQIKVC